MVAAIAELKPSGVFGLLSRSIYENLSYLSHPALLCRSFAQASVCLLSWTIEPEIARLIAPFIWTQE